MRDGPTHLMSAPYLVQYCMVIPVSVSHDYSVVLELLAEVTVCLHQLVSLLLIRASGGRQLLLILRDITRVSRGRMSRAGCKIAKQMVSSYLNDHITASFDGNKAQRYFNPRPAGPSPDPTRCWGGGP